MVVDEPAIRFSPDDVPDMPEISNPKKRQRKKPRTPEPKDWQPIGVEW